MDKKLINPRFLAVTCMVLFAAALRLVPHYPNFTPIAAMALFGGAYFSNKKFAFIVPLAAMFISDLIIGFHSTMWAVYLSFAVVVMIGFSLRKSKKISNIFLAVVSSSVLFFVVTNFAVWMMGTMYPMTLSGLAESYVAAIPFFSYSVLGDLFYAGVFFGAFEFAKIKFPVLAKAEV
jgi:hypothetical protein